MAASPQSQKENESLSRRAIPCTRSQSRHNAYLRELPAILITGKPLMAAVFTCRNSWRVLNPRC